MIFVTGPMFSGKREYLQKTLGLTAEELSARAVFDAEKLAAGEEAAASLEEAASLSAALEAASRSGSAALELLEVLAVAVGRKSSSAVGVPRRVN